MRSRSPVVTPISSEPTQVLCNHLLLQMGDGQSSLPLPQAFCYCFEGVSG